MNELETSLLKKIFEHQIKGAGELDAVEFRAKNYENLDVIDSLESLGYIEKNDDKYYLHVIGIAAISGLNKEAQNVLDNSDKLFNELHKHYRNKPKHSIGRNDLSKLTNLPKQNVSAALSIMVQTHIFGSYSSNLYQEDSEVRPNEAILKFKSFEEVVKQHQEWRLGKTNSVPEQLFVSNTENYYSGPFETLLHPEVSKHALAHYMNGHLRDAVLNSIIAVFDLIRLRTKLNEDGDKLVGKALSLDDPYLVLSEIGTESGQNDQKGFMQILKGAYQGIRNPKAHSLNHDLTEEKAAQYLVLSSLLARRIEEAHLIKERKPEKVA